MIASSGTVLSNLAYLIGAVVVAATAGFGIWFRHRQPKSTDATMASFRKGLSALAPDLTSGSPPAGGRARPVTPSLTHVRVEDPNAAAGDG